VTKRLFDIVVASLGLVVTAPLMALLALGVLATMGSPVTFRQERVGRGGRGFELFKFRSMREARDAAGRPLPDAERTAPLGRFLRASRLDELPELWLVLRGDMSVVGPRPLPRPILEEHGVVAARSRARPGLTGLAQVSGNTKLSAREKFAIDLYYIDHRSMALDLAVIWKTIRVVLTGETRDVGLIEKAMAYANHPDRSG
jgi:lipopolysaccharide/colanic/teichoic acid biosynthesis glycosyltransferase